MDPHVFRKIELLQETNRQKSLQKHQKSLKITKNPVNHVKSRFEKIFISFYFFVHFVHILFCHKQLQIKNDKIQIIFMILLSFFLSPDVNKRQMRSMDSSVKVILRKEQVY